MILAIRITLTSIVTNMEKDLVILIAIIIVTIIFVTADSIHSALITVTWTRLSYCSIYVYFLH